MISNSAANFVKFVNKTTAFEHHISKIKNIHTLRGRLREVEDFVDILLGGGGPQCSAVLLCAGFLGNTRNRGRSKGGDRYNKREQNGGSHFGFLLSDLSFVCLCLCWSSLYELIIEMSQTLQMVSFVAFEPIFLRREKKILS